MTMYCSPSALLNQTILFPTEFNLVSNSSASLGVQFFDVKTLKSVLYVSPFPEPRNLASGELENEL